ncbi:DUF3299 domain-containing protein [Hyphomonas sp. NPDC076900]|uniref:DUF3299 domain-containing protein n=1 Tax=unclassified Hyphomonas TaxID=2630699 RepID=UPI003CFF345F
MIFLLAACGGGAPDGQNDALNEPPPMPEGAVSETFERPSPSAYVSEPGQAVPESGGENGYWGVREGEALPIIWEDLMPQGAGEALEQEYAEFYKALEARYASQPMEMIEEGSDLDYMPQLGGFDTVPELDGMLIRIPGYVVPFDFNLKNKQAAFLLAPYMGACIHTPPPPPNQIIYVEADPAVKIDDIWTAYWLEGTLSAQTQESDLAAAAYTLTLTKIEPYGVP